MSFKTYKCHKVVEAAQITEVLDENFVVIGQGDVIDVTNIPYAKKVGDYLVRYSDGFLSVSPRDAFEDGYSRV